MTILLRDIGKYIHILAVMLLMQSSLQTSYAEKVYELYFIIMAQFFGAAIVF